MVTDGRCGLFRQDGSRNERELALTPLRKTSQSLAMRLLDKKNETGIPRDGVRKQPAT